MNYHLVKDNKLASSQLVTSYSGQRHSYTNIVAFENAYKILILVICVYVLKYNNAQRGIGSLEREIGFGSKCILHLIFSCYDEKHKKLKKGE